MSTYLNDIIAKQHGSTNVMVVFLDVVKYSLRKSVMQQKVISKFNEVVISAMDSISALYVKDSQQQNINLATDIIKIPTGDGIAVVFPFQGFQNIHLDFALRFLSASLESRNEVNCQIFASNGWCNCHDFFDVRIGIAEGKSIIFNDVNGHYNVAGGTVNFASRVMGLADRQQILFTNDAYSKLIDMTEDTSLESKFVVHGPVSVKHDLKIDICQYIGGGENFLNADTPMRIQIEKRKEKLMEKHPMLQEPRDELKKLEIMELMGEMPEIVNINLENKEDILKMIEAAKTMSKFMVGRGVGK
jgi:class 3 adenylate cyclase